MHRVTLLLGQLIFARIETFRFSLSLTLHRHLSLTLSLPLLTSSHSLPGDLIKSIEPNHSAINDFYPNVYTYTS